MAMTIPDLYRSHHETICAALGHFVKRLLADGHGYRGGRNRSECDWLTIVETIEDQGLREAECLHPMLRIAAPGLAAELDAQHSALEHRANLVLRALSAICVLSRTAARRQALRAVGRDIGAFLTACERHQSDERRRAQGALADAFAPPALHAAARAMARGNVSGATALEQGKCTIAQREKLHPVDFERMRRDVLRACDAEVRSSSSKRASSIRSSGMGHL